MPQSLTPEIVTAAIAGFEQQKRRIDEQIAELRSMLPSRNPQPAAPETDGPKRPRFSAASRRKMAEAQRARWAKVRGEAAAAPAEAPKPKSKISPEGLKRIIAAQKKRWALKRAEVAKTAQKTARAGRNRPSKNTSEAGRRTAQAKRASKTPTAKAPSTAAVPTAL